MHDISTGYGDDGGDVCAETYKTSNTTNTAALADRPTAAAAAVTGWSAAKSAHIQSAGQCWEKITKKSSG